MARPLLDELDAHREPLRHLVARGRRLWRGRPVAVDQATSGRSCSRVGSSPTPSAPRRPGSWAGSAPDDDPYGTPRLHVDERTNVLDDELRPRGPGLGRRRSSGPQRPHPHRVSRRRREDGGHLRGGRRQALGPSRRHGHRRADGTITVLGRGSLCINTGGEKVFPDEVEAAAEELRRRRGRRRRRRARRALGERVVAVVQPRAGPRSRRRLAARCAGTCWRATRSPARSW